MKCVTDLAYVFRGGNTIWKWPAVRATVSTTKQGRTAGLPQGGEQQAQTGVKGWTEKTTWCFHPVKRLSFHPQSNGRSTTSFHSQEFGPRDCILDRVDRTRFMFWNNHVSRKTTFMDSRLLNLTLNKVISKIQKTKPNNNQEYSWACTPHLPFY